MYNLVTKQNRYDLPTREDFHECLVLMREHASANQVLEIHMPRLGAGLDRLYWEDSKQTILTVFKNQNLRLSVYVHHVPAVRRDKTSGRVNKSLSDDEETLPYGLEERLSGHDLLHAERDNSTKDSNVSGSTRHRGNVSALCSGSHRSGPSSDKISSGEPLPPTEASTKPSGGQKSEIHNSKKRWNTPMEMMGPPSDRISPGERRSVKPPTRPSRS